MNKVLQIKIDNLNELENLAKKVDQAVGKSAIVALIGELGAGKTTFTKFLLKAAGIKSKVTSPTFVLMVPHKKKAAATIYYHLDLYRTKNFKEIQALGVQDLWGKNQNVFLIEWADKIRKHLPKQTVTLKFRLGDEPHSRIIEILNAPKKLVNMLK